MQLKRISYEPRGRWRTEHARQLVLLSACGWWASACTGTAGSGSSTKLPSVTEVDVARACVDDRGGVPTPAPLRRLTLREYATTVESLTGVDPTTFMAGFPADLKTSGMFDVEATSSATTATLTENFRRVADLVSKEATNESKRSAFVGCDAGGASRVACLATFIDRFAPRAWRRPLSTEERADFVALAATGTDGWDGAALVVYAALQSPSFLFRPEFGEEPTNRERPGLMRLTPHEMAARLSFLLVGEAPDPAFFTEARLSSLTTQEGVRAVATELLQDPRATQLAEQLFVQWFGLSELDGQQRSTSLYPDFSPELLASMNQEVSSFLTTHGWGESANFSNIFVSTQTQIDARLAPVYGASVSSGTPVAFDMSTVADRGGFFSLPGVLTVIGRNRDNPSIVARGKWVKENIFCEVIPPPPPNTEIIEPGVDESSAEAANRHQTDPVCRGCHALIDPIGRGLERYDAIGAIRTKYPGGQPLPTDGALPMLNNTPFTTAPELGQLVYENDTAQRCITQHLWRWTSAQKLSTDSPTDVCTADALHTLMKNKNYNLREALLEYVASDAFRFRPPVID